MDRSGAGLYAAIFARPQLSGASIDALSLESQLPDSLFVRVHRSTNIRRDSIAAVRRKRRKRFVILQNGNQLPIGPRYTDRITATAQTGRVGGSETVTE
jgi:hypothetical protein